jgi:hypothetical protein
MSIAIPVIHTWSYRLAGRQIPLAPRNGVMRLSAAQLAALIEGLDWMRVHARRVVAQDRLLLGDPARRSMGIGTGADIGTE